MTADIVDVVVSASSGYNSWVGLEELLGIFTAMSFNTSFALLVEVPDLLECTDISITLDILSNKFLSSFI